MSGIEDRIRLRIVIIGLIVLAMFGVLVARLWFLQVLAGEDFAVAARNNSVRIVSREAPRGRILDRKGRVLVDNRIAQAVGIRRDGLPKDPKEALRIKRRVANLLGITVKEIDRRLADVRVSPYKAVVIAEDVPEDVIFTIRERQYTTFHGVETFPLPVRTYPRGTLAAHILGYVGETTEADLDRYPRRYRLGDSIGKTGVEATFERFLRGQSGLDKLEVDATGRVLRSLSGANSRPPISGSDIYLTIDAKVQRVAERALVEGMQRARSSTFAETGERFRAPAGAVVVLDPRTGEVVAMASHPTFQPRRFVGGVDPDYWGFLNDTANHNPLLNRAIQSAYPPGSTFKPFLATGALATGAATPGGTYPCQTTWRFGDTVFRNWQPRDENITVAQSLIESCDTVYYHFARLWWYREQNQIEAGREPDEVMQGWARRFGLGSPTGIALPSEAGGRIPTRELKRRVWEANQDAYCETYRETRDALFKDLCENGFLWRGGDAVNMSIGQGDVAATPLQMAVGYAAIANGGDVLEPLIVRKIVSSQGIVEREVDPKLVKRVKADPGSISYVQRALGEVAERGTAVFPYRYWPLGKIPMAAKTGSSEIAGKQPFSWFASYGPLDDPRYVAIAVVEEAGFGSQVSGPIVRRVMDELFDQPPLPIVFGTRSD